VVTKLLIFAELSFARFLSLVILSLRLSNCWIPIIVKVSAMRFALIVVSRGLSQASEGLRLTSSNQGLSSESIRIS
jgi:hypothetical protein